MKNNKRKYLILATFIVQVFVLLGGIFFINWFVSNGETYLVEAKGYDPYDPLRGRYIALTLFDREVAIQQGEKVPDSTSNKTIPVYVILEKDPEGIATIKSYSFKRPKGEVYLKINNWWKNNESGNSIWLSPKMDQYYVNQETAPALEKMIREGKKVLLEVKIQKGFYIVKQLIVDGKTY